MSAAVARAALRTFSSSSVAASTATAGAASPERDEQVRNHIEPDVRMPERVQYASSPLYTSAGIHLPLTVNSVNDFCLWAPPEPGPNSYIGDSEQIEVSWCLQDGYGTRLIPNGTISGAHWTITPDYVQVTGAISDPTKLNIPANDQGGELDPHGADGNGNPVGGIVFSSAFGQLEQIFEWTNFMEGNIFCFRACNPKGSNPPQFCEHIYDVMGCEWNMPGNYDTGFTSCEGDSGEPMGVYGSSTFYQGQGATPAAHPAPATRSCTTFSTVGNALATSASSLPSSMTEPTPTASGSSGSKPTASGSHSSSGSAPASTSSAGQRNISLFWASLFSFVGALLVLWSILERSFEREIIPMARAHGMALAPWDVVASGKIRTDAEEQARRESGLKGRMIFGPNWERNETEVKISHALEKVAAEVGAKSIQAVAIAYVMQKTPCAFLIIGGHKVEHMPANIEALNIALSPEHIAFLEGTLPFEVGFPASMIGDGSSQQLLTSTAGIFVPQPRLQPIRPTKD
ncbi:hypothetical protein HMN09_00324500 [Mycena chlorophos]|uniref:NADP-dependent oxidoreductase domain-containing protein n=1 Tax=Mycena chlorophos TaxID=658473 RepID=A0A8H6TGB4_MYCCL|nr:hypothetical protein HMN09_00324500 [Mycena chlorophos]